MTSESDELELLFFETFSHEASEEINLDLVQFPKPVVIGEVRIIPLGARVQADFPGGVRLGATNPSQFKIEFFVNDLSKPGASTFENLGSIDYNQNGNIRMDCETKITTDGLVLRGWYTTITLAVYGALSKAAESNTNQVSLQDPASSQPPEWQANQGHGEFETARMNESDPNWELRDEKHWNKEAYKNERSPVEYPREHNTPEYDGPRRRDPAHYQGTGWEWSKRPRSPPPTPPAQQPTPPPPPPPREEVKEERSSATSGRQFESLLSPGDVESISDGDIAEEPIDQFSDDDDDIDLELPDYQFQSMEEDIPGEMDDYFKEFDPFTFEIKPFKVLKSPVDEWCCRKPENSVQMANVISSVRDPRQGRLAWVEAVDDLLTLLPSTINDSYIEDKLVEWTEVGCSWPAEEAEPTVRVRHAKAGVRLAEAAAASGLSPRLVRAGIHHALLDLYDKPHMAHSIRAMALRALDAIANEPSAVAELVSPVRTERSESIYRRLLRTLRKGRPVAAKAPAVPLVAKIHFAHLLDTLASLVKEKTLDVPTIYDCVMEIYRVYREAPRLLYQPVRFLPVSSLFSLPSTSDPTLTLYGYMDSAKLGDSLATALDNGSQIVAPIAALTAAMADRWDGLRFLAGWGSVLTSLKRSEPGLAAGLAVRLSAVSIIDTILADPVADKDSVVENLRLLYNLASSPATRNHCLAAIAFHQPLSTLLNLLGQRPCQKRKSPSRGYITDILSRLVQHHPSPGYLMSQSKELSAVATDFSELSHLTVWIKPALISPIVYDNFNAVYDLVKNNVDSSASLPGELITALRILRRLVIPDHESSLIAVQPEFKELKYKYALLNIYSLGGLADLVNILKRIGARFDQPIMHTASLCGTRGLQLLSLVLPVVQILRRMIVLVIQRRGADFKDLTAVPILLKTYNLLLTLSAESQAEGDVKIACQEIIEALLGYTQASSEGALGKSLWTQLIQEVVKWTLDLPMNYVSGCVILSELLPLPLPVRSIRDLSDDEVTQLVSWRKLWSAHVHAASCFEELAATLCVSGHQPLVEALRRVCLQLADLAAPTAVSLARALLDAVADAGPYRPHALAFLGTLAAHAPVKAALIHLLVPDPPKVDEKCLSLFLSQFESTSCLEGLLSIVQPLCYPSISLASGSAQLPPKELLSPVCEVMGRHLSSPDAGPSTVLPVLRIFCVLSDSDYGLYYTKHGLSAGGAGVLRSVLENHTDQGVAGWCAALGCSLSGASRAVNRSTSLSRSDLAALFAFDKESPQTHPLSILLEKANSESQSECEDQSRKLAWPGKENLETLLKILKGETEYESKDVVEVAQSELKDPMWQFAHREVYVKSESVDFEQLSPSYWLSPPYHRSYIEPNKDLVTVDLMEVSEKEVTGWEEAVAELWQKEDSEDDQQREQPGSEVIPGQQGDKQPFIAPKLGRGGTAVSSSSGDAFRSRPPNTSRPPSLHVDDFVALETCGAQPTGPTGYNKLTMRAAQDLLGLRGGMRGNNVRMPMPPPPPDRGMRFFGQTYLPPPHLAFPFYHHHF